MKLWLVKQRPPLFRGYKWRCRLCGREVIVREYPDSDPPAVFMDCFVCRRTWETTS